MPCCSAVECSSRTEKGVRLFSLPRGVKNKERTKQWMINIKRTKLPDTVYVCEKHFTPDQFENTRADNKRPLRWNAIPTIFNYNNEKRIKQRKAPTVRCNPEKEIKSLNDTNVQIEVDAANNLNLAENASTSAETEINVDGLELKRKLQLAQKKIRQLRQETETLQQQIKNVFNEDQIDFLKRGRMTGRQWHTNTIKKSLKLYLSCGTTGYEELRRQNYPVPSIRTLQKRIQDFKFRPGILHGLFPLLEAKIEYIMKPEERHAVLLVDEMALQPGLQFDNATGDIIGKATIPTSGGKSNDNVQHMR